MDYKIITDDPGPEQGRDPYFSDIRGEKFRKKRPSFARCSGFSFTFAAPISSLELNLAPGENGLGVQP